MAFDEKLAARVRNEVADCEQISERKMFGGICFMDRGNMFCGVVGDRLMVRVGPKGYEKALKLKHTSKMDFTGTPLKGLIFVQSQGIRNKKDLSQWLKRALTYTATLPAKPKKSGPASLLRNNRKSNVNGPTPLSSIKNFGPVTRAEFRSMGITTLEQIKEIGFEEMCRKYVLYYPERLNANAFLGIICSIENTVWTQATRAQRNAAHAMARELRAEFGMRI